MQGTGSLLIDPFKMDQQGAGFVEVDFPEIFFLPIGSVEIEVFHHFFH